MIYRLETVNGILYNSSRTELINQIRKFFLDPKLGTKTEPLVEQTNEFQSFIIPNHDYETCGYAMAHAYKKIGENIKPELVIILGCDHYNEGLNISLFPEGEFVTPLGNVKVDKEFNESLEKTGQFFIDELSHSREYSIEVQLPFLKYVFKDECPNIVPILFDNNLITMSEIDSASKALYDVWVRSGKRVLFIASSNLHQAKKGEDLNLVKEKDKKGEILTHYLSSEVRNDKEVIDFASIQF